MKKAELRAQAGDVFPASYEHLEKNQMTEVKEQMDPSNAKAINFVLPMLVFVVATIYTDGDILMGGIYSDL